MNRKEKWIDEVMSSMSNMQGAKASTTLHERILAATRQQIFFYKKAAWAMAAGLLLLLGINTLTLIHFKKQEAYSAESDKHQNIIATDYFNYIDQ